MIYSFNQNNSFGTYHGPAITIIVVDAKDQSHALDTAKKAGLYLNGVADGVDCDCCGDRWHSYAYEHDTLQEAKDTALLLTSEYAVEDSVPLYLVTDDLDHD
tara:strand:+ start:168 stop:473 length:306 start_codon:yes stop_codon:yes gene_type:complete